MEDYKKKYEEVLKRIKECVPDDNGFITIYPQEIFPELSESEDERIRKELIDIVAKSPITFAFEDKGKVLAWLEKQGEPKDILEDAILDSNEDGLIAETICCKKEKQDEKKPAEWNEEDEAYCRLLIDIMDVEHRDGIFSINPEDISIFKSDVVTVKRIKDWLKSLKGRFTWKPSDEQMDALAWALSLAKNCGEECAFELNQLQEQLKKLREE